MKMRSRKNRHWLPCALAAVCMAMFLIVLPRADSVPTGTAHDTGETSAVQSSASSSDSNASSGSVSQSSVASGLNSSSTSASAPQSSAVSGSDSSAASSSEQQSSAAANSVSSNSSSGKAQSSAASSSNSSSAPSGSSASGSASSRVRKTDYRFENDSVIVTAIPSRPSALPDGAELCVAPILGNKDPERYLAIQNSVTDSMKAARSSITGFLAYDIYFSAGGKKIEPGNTAVTIRFKHNASGDGTGKDAEGIRVLHLKEAGGAVRAEDVTTVSAPGTALRNGLLTGTGKFDTDSSCVFAVAGVKAMPKASASFSADDIRNSLAPVLPYAVFADSFTLTGDMEGCIAVDKAAIGSDFGNSASNFMNNCITSNSVTVEKTYTGTKQRTFWFGLYGSTGKLEATKNMTLQASSKKSITFPVTGNVGSYTVSELDSSYNPIGQGKTVDEVTLEKVDKQGTETGYSGINCTSYVNQFNLTSDSHRLKSDLKYPPNKLVVGSGNKVVNTSDGAEIVCGGYTFFCSKPNVLTQAEPENFPINFTKVLSDMGNLSEQLAQMDPNDSGPVIVKNFTRDQMNQNNSKITTGGNLLVINIDATDYPQLFEIPAQFKMNVDGESGGSFVKAAGNVVVNIYAKDENGKPVPYQGKITNAGFLMGTLLAPLADVTDIAQPYNGTIVAKSVDNTQGEIHSADGGYYGSNVIWNFENVECAACSLPETGGPGAAAFAAVGIGLLLLGTALAVFLYRRVLRKTHGGKLFSGGSSPPDVPRRDLTRTKGETQNTS